MVIRSITVAGARWRITRRRTVQRYVHALQRRPGGQAPTGAVIGTESLALDYGVSGSSCYEVNAIDGPMGENSPYAGGDVVRSSGGRARCARMGNLRGVFGGGRVQAVRRGRDLGIESLPAYLKRAVELRNLPLLMLGNSGARVEAHSGGLFGLDNFGAGRSRWRRISLVAGAGAGRGRRDAGRCGAVRALGRVRHGSPWRATSSSTSRAAFSGWTTAAPGRSRVWSPGGHLGRTGVERGRRDDRQRDGGAVYPLGRVETRLTVAGDILVQTRSLAGTTYSTNRPVRRGWHRHAVLTGLWLTGADGLLERVGERRRAVIQSDGVTRFGRNVSGSTAMTGIKRPGGCAFRRQGVATALWSCGRTARCASASTPAIRAWRACVYQQRRHRFRTEGRRSGAPGAAAHMPGLWMIGQHTYQQSADAIDGEWCIVPAVIDYGVIDRSWTRASTTDRDDRGRHRGGVCRLAQADTLDAEADALDAQANELIETALKKRREATEIRARYKSVAADDAPLRRLKEMVDAKREVKEPDERG